MAKTSSTFSIIIGSLIGLYGIIYLILSLNGSYQPIRTVAGVPTHVGWEPVGMSCSFHKSVTGDEVIKSNFLAKLFYPLLIIDRKLWHPTRTVGEDLRRGIRQILNESTTP